MTFLLIIIVTLILILASFITKVRHFLLLLFSLLVFHYKVSSFFTAFILSSILSLQKFCHFLLLLFSRVELKANSKKTLWLNHHFMALLSSATQTQLYRTKDFRGLKFATNLQQSCTIFEFFRWARSGRGACAVFPLCVSRAETCWSFSWKLLNYGFLSNYVVTSGEQIK